MTAQQAHILIVEDRDDWREIICDTVSGQGYQPHPAESYARAEALLTEHQFDLAVVDPVLDTRNRFNRDGLSVVQKIGRAQPNIPVVILTGSLSQDLEASLKHLCPQAPILFKEKWDPAQFNALLANLTHTEQASGLPPVIEGEKTPSAGRISPITPVVLNQPRVLLVENREDWQAIVTDILEREGYFWRVASSAQQALRELEMETFHLVILDLKLQDMDLPMRSHEGWLLLDFLVEARPKTKLAILSGRAGPSDVAELLTNYPIIKFIEKQKFDPQMLRDAVTEATQAPELRIQTLGEFKLWRNGEIISSWTRPQAEKLVKILLARRAREGRAVSADELITHLWPEADETGGRKKLRPLISNARHTLEPEIEPRDSNFILRSSTGYFFDLSGQVRWDLLIFRQHFQMGRQLFEEERYDEAIAELEAGRALYYGDFLAEDRYEDWAIELRREASADYRDLLILLADAYAINGDNRQAIEACQAALAKDPLLESVYRRLMRYHYCLGEKGQALKVYRDCYKLFEELFGESPTPATRQLEAAIANDEAPDCLPGE